MKVYFVGKNWPNAANLIKGLMIGQSGVQGVEIPLPIAYTAITSNGMKIAATNGEIFEIHSQAVIVVSPSSMKEIPIISFMETCDKAGAILLVPEIEDEECVGLSRFLGLQHRTPILELWAGRSAAKKSEPPMHIPHGWQLTTDNKEAEKARKAKNAVHINCFIDPDGKTSVTLEAFREVPYSRYRPSHENLSPVAVAGETAECAELTPGYCTRYAVNVDGVVIKKLVPHYRWQAKPEFNGDDICPYCGFNNGPNGEYRHHGHDCGGCGSN